MVADRILGPFRSMDRQKRTMMVAGLALAISTAGVGYWAGSSGVFTENGSSAGAQEGETVDGVVQDGSGRKVLYWYDPMIPMERYDAPGKSSMNMELIPKYADEAADGGVRVSPAMTQSLGVRIGEAQVRDLAPTVQGVGRVQIDERLIEEVQTFAPGFVESLAVRAEGEPVQAGTRIASVYAPELLTAQHEYKSLLGMSRDVAPPSLREAARSRLRLLGLSSGAIQRLESGAAPQRTYAVFAPASGIVTEIGARPGARVAPGQSTVPIPGLSRVWAVAETPEAAPGDLNTGQPVRVPLAAPPAPVSDSPALQWGHPAVRGGCCSPAYLRRLRACLRNRGGDRRPPRRQGRAGSVNRHHRGSVASLGGGGNPRGSSRGIERRPAGPGHLRRLSGRGPRGERRLYLSLAQSRDPHGARSRHARQPRPSTQGRHVRQCDRPGDRRHDPDGAERGGHRDRRANGRHHAAEWSLRPRRGDRKSTRLNSRH